MCREKSTCRGCIVSRDGLLARRFAAYDALGIRRAATPDDLPAARWLAAEAGPGAWLDPVAIPRFDPLVARLDWPGGAIEGLALFDGGLTGPDGIAGVLGAMGGPATIGFAELDPAAASLKDMPFARARRAVGHAALVIALRTLGDGLAPLNAPDIAQPFGPPVLQVAGREAALLQRLAGEGARVRVTVTGTRATGQSANVLAALPGGALPPLVVMTPRTSWWASTAERGGGIMAWLAVLEALGAAPPRRPVRFAATCGHELGHVGLLHWLAAEPGLVAEAAVFLHLGANLGAAGDARLTLRSNVPGLAERMAAALVAQGYPPAALILAPGTVAFGEAHDILARGGRFLSLIGANPRFHAPDDRWPEAVDLTAAAAIAAAVASVASSI